MTPAKRARPARGGGAGRGDASLRRLADALGIIDSYVDQTGRRRVTRDDTRVAILSALGVDASSSARAREALARLEEERRARLLPPVRVVRRSDLARELTVAAAADEREWDVVLHAEAGDERADSGRFGAGRGARSARLPVAPEEMAAGYHRLTVRVGGRGDSREQTQRLIVVPDACPSPAGVLAGRRVFGVIANLYALRSARNWGAGDLTDLRYLVEWAAEQGAAFVGVNPLHALRNSGMDVSPYSPVSRLFRNPLYIDVDAVPELAESAEARERLSSAQQALGALRDGDLVDYEGVMAAKRAVLEPLHRAFHAAHGSGRSARAREYQAWRDRQGDTLENFATWCAIDETMRDERGAGAPGTWREWRADLRDPGSSEVRAFRERHAERVDLHRWLQFELDRQLGTAAERGRAMGMPVGLYQDLAIGTSDSGSDTWAFPGLFLEDVSVGAPPDPLAAHGQNWGLPPVNPHRLQAGGYEYWTRLVRSAFRHAGALRIDHVIGIFRQFWIPRGMPGERGAYMRFPSEDLLGIIALEAERAGALVVGEDLGTVPPEVGPALERWSMLSSKVLYFERGAKGSFRRARDYARTALTTANTHDLATLAGFWTERDLELREEVGDLRGRAVGQARRNRDVDREALADMLAEEGLLPESEEALDHTALRAAVHAFLRRTPSWLVGLALDDLLGETEPVNLPGIHPDKYPMWRVRQRAPLERLREDPAVRRALGAERVWVP